MARSKPIGDQLRAWRESTGINQASLALRAKTSERMVRMIECGVTEDPRGKTLGKLCKALGCCIVIYSADKIEVEALR
jgi:transcriptional regulator with XRE-family HTH domain